MKIFFSTIIATAALVGAAQALQRGVGLSGSSLLIWPSLSHQEARICPLSLAARGLGL